MLKKWLFGIFVASGLFLTVQAQDNQATVSPKEVAGQCQVSLIETAHLKFRGSDKDAEYGTCFVDLKSSANASSERISLIFSPISRVERNCCIVGFQRSSDKTGQWLFVGTKDVLLESRFLKRSFTHEENGDDELLVGNQLIRGGMPNGGTTELPGIRILRLTPQFAISVELDFEPMTSELSVKAYRQRLAAVIRELVEIVKSIQPTPGQSGPTIRAQP